MNQEYYVPSIFDSTEHYDSQTSPGKWSRKKPSIWKVKFKDFFHNSIESVYVEEFYSGKFENNNSVVTLYE
jgi:hypothetical protein